MDLRTVENVFDENYGLEFYREKTEKTLKKTIDDANDNYLASEFEKLPKGISFKDMIINFKCINVFIYNSDRDIPFFRVCFNLLHPKTEIPIFYYEVDYDISGNFSDEYFGEY